MNNKFGAFLLGLTALALFGVGLARGRVGDIDDLQPGTAVRHVTRSLLYWMA